jgi:calcium permeable stress-gated cation channel
MSSTEDPKDTGSSASALVSTLAPVLVVAVVWFTLFVFLRRKFPRKYEPRSFVNSLDEQ